MAEVALLFRKNLGEEFLSHCLEYLTKFAKERRYIYNMSNNIEKFMERKAEKKKIIKLADELNFKYKEIRNEVEKIIKLHQLKEISKNLFPFIGILYNSK